MWRFIIRISIQIGSSLTFFAFNKKYKAPKIADPKSTRQTKILEVVPSFLCAPGSNARQSIPTTAKDRPINSDL